MVYGVLQAWAGLPGVDRADKPCRAHIGGQNAVRGVQWAGAAQDQLPHHSTAACRCTAARANRSQHVHKLAVSLQKGSGLRVQDALALCKPCSRAKLSLQVHLS